MNRVASPFLSGGGRGALAGAVSAGMFSQLHGMSPGVGKVLAHGAVGGIMSEMQGGDFRSGFLAAGFTQALSPAIGGIDSGTVGPSAQRTIAAAIVGGTASVIGGGKFANGAVTGAFSRLFNDDKQAWMDRDGKIHPGEHPDHKSGTCGRNANCAAGIADPRPPSVRLNRESMADFFGQTARYSEYAAAASALSLQPEGVLGFGVTSVGATFLENVFRPDVVDVVRGGMIDVMVEPLPMQFEVPAGLVIKEVIEYNKGTSK